MNSNHNHKETFKLLNVSDSDSGSDVPDLSVNLPRRKIKVKRKFRPGNDHKMGDSDKRCCSLSATWKVLSVILLLSLLVAIVTLLVHLYDRNDQLNKRLQEILSESRQFPEEFHDIHSRLKNLEANGTFFWESVVKINTDIATLRKDVDVLKQTADSLSKSIAAAPQIVTLPKDVTSLQNDVASMGSKIKDLEIKLQETKDGASSVNKANNVEALQEFRTIIDNLNQSMSSRIQETADRAVTIKSELQAVKNSSAFLEARVDALQNNARNYEQISEHLQGVVDALVNRSEHQVGLQRVPNALPGDNVTLEQLTGHVRNLTKVYHALVEKMRQVESDSHQDLNTNLLNMNVTDGLEKMMTTALQGAEYKLFEKFKNESLYVDYIEQQLQLLITELNSERNSTSQLTRLNVTSFTGLDRELLHKLPSLGPPPSTYLWPVNATNTTEPVRNSRSGSSNGRR